MSDRSKSSPRGTLFCSISAQWDNLGDVEIRRTILDLLSDQFDKQAIYCGSMPIDYVAMFSSGTHVKFYSKYMPFLCALLLEISKGRASLLFAPGPVLMVANVQALLKSVSLVLVVMMVRRRGGQVLAIGRSLRGVSSLALAIERTLQKFCTVYTLRDGVSASLLGVDTVVAPDIAFANVPRAPTTERNVIGISLRYDRPPDLVLLTKVIRDCEESEKTPIFVSQVKRDDEQHRYLADFFGCSALLWGDKSHSDQFAVVMNLYERAHTVISDRLHVLILAAEAGAFPIEIKTAASDKIQSTVSRWLDVPVLNHVAEFGRLNFLDGRDEERGRQIDGLRAVQLEVLKSVGPKY
ncbi:hypothetical protein IWX65_002950 [Arthrobacter sp. CAN_A214]|uniref:polysaccharide pyruvyl transferase family protein n=1 Tax=Arthrobacter sp. CAN_A214 TaxID=2787720 RepID=UPI0018CA286C